MRSLIKYLSIILISIISSFIIFEIYANYRSDLFPSYGWQQNNILEKKIDKCNKNKNIGVFGDSFVEYFGSDQNNLVEILDHKFDNYNLCNFGMSGDSINHYISRFVKVIESNIKLDKAIFFIYEGNDFYEFRYAKGENFQHLDLNNFKINGNNIFDYSDKFIIDRKLPFYKNFIKSTFSINIIYREIIKKYFFKKKIDHNFVKNIYSEDKYFEVKLNQAISRMEKTPLEIKELLSADILNVNFYKLALRNPNYFKEIFNPDPKLLELQKKIAIKHVNYINKKCEKYVIDCKIIIIPTDMFLFKKAKIKYQKKFMFNEQNEYGKSKIVNFLTEYYSNIYYPSNILKYSDYIKNDMHLNGKGNQNIANFTYDLFKIN